MFSALARFIFPQVCLYCKEVHEGKGLLCACCLPGMELLSRQGRCRICFREGCSRRCRKEGFPWLYRAALFEKGSFATPLFYDPERFSKEIAALYVIQYLRVWGRCEIVHAESVIGEAFCRFYPMPKTSRWRDYSGVSVLWLGEVEEVPKRLQGARIHCMEPILL